MSTQQTTYRLETVVSDGHRVHTHLVARFTTARAAEHARKMLAQRCPLTTYRIVR